MAKRTGQDIIAAFFKALSPIDLPQCQRQLRALSQLAKHQPEYRSWHIYLTAVMANELHRNWAKGERLLTMLLSTDLETRLRGRVLIALGRTYDYQGRWHEAFTAYNQSLAIFQQLAQPMEQAKIWKNMAISLQKGFAQGIFSSDALHQAISYCRLVFEQIHVLEEPSVSDLWLEATTWNTLGVVYFSLKDWPQATECFRQRIVLGQRLADRHGIAVASHNLGEVFHHQGFEHWSEAEHSYQKALRLFQECSDQYEEIDVLANLAALHHDMGDLASARQHYERAIVLIERMRAGASSEEARTGFFATVSNTYANAVLLCLEIKDVVRAFELVERARSRAFLDVLAARSPELSEQVEAPTMTLAELQASLPPETLLLEYFTTGLAETRASVGTQRHRFPPAKTIIFAVTRETIQAHDARLDPEKLQSAQPSSVAEKPFLEAQPRHAQYNRLIAPFEQLLQGKRRLYLIPHGPLHTIPFQALLAPDGTPLLCEDGPQLIYGPSATVLFRHRQMPVHRTPESCLAIGFNGVAPHRLVFGEEEARSVARKIGGCALVGPTPKKDELYAQAGRYELLHFSCHGFFNSDSPLDSFLLLAPDETLTALDVLKNLRLACHLVVLSACESGLSRVRRGDELFGLVRAFMYAGAPALVCSLWRVEEHATRLLMERFYHELQAGAECAEALRRAQLFLMTLTRRQAHELLIRLWTSDHIHQNVPTVPRPATLNRRAGAYFKGLATARADDRAAIPPQGDDDFVYADPHFWAPFILIGDPETSR